MLRAWVLLPLAGLLGSSACGERCNPNANVGGGSGSLETLAVVRLLEPESAFGSAEAAERELTGVLGLDAFIVAQGDMAGRVDVLLGAGPEGLEVHASMLAVANAEDHLATRYALEPMMFRQVRIKPSQGRTRCMLFNERIACALGEARLGRGAMALDRLGRGVADAGRSVADAGRGVADAGRGVADASAWGEPVLEMRVLAEEPFAKHVVPRVQTYLADALARADAPASLRKLVLERDPHEIGAWLARFPWTLRARGTRLMLEGWVPLSLPAGWQPGGPSLEPVPGLAALSWLPAADTPSDGGAPEPGLEPAPAEAGVVARARLDLKPLGEAGTVLVRLFRSGANTRLEIEMDRASLVGWLHTMSANAGGPALDHATH